MAASVLVIEDHPLLREALNAAITDDPGLKIAGQVESNTDLLDMLITTSFNTVLLAFKPDIILFGLDKTGQAELETIKEIRKALPNTAILALTNSDTDGQSQAALDAGAQRVLSKSEPRSEIINALHSLRSFSIEIQEINFNHNVDQYLSKLEVSSPSH